MIQKLLKYVVLGVAAGIIGYVGLSAYGEVSKTEAAKMSESVELAQTQAQNMNQALTDVSHFGTAEQQQPAEVVANQQRPAEVQDAPPKSFAEIDGSHTTGAAGVASVTQPQPTPPPDIASITSIDVLIAEWQPSYDTAKVAYVKFEASINNAKSQAAGYFAKQQALTEQIRDPDNQAKARQEDEWEMSLYRQWESKADAALKMASDIGIQLDDMDASLKKMELRAGFVFDSSGFQEVPQAINDLNQQLVDFQTASENIKSATGSAFEAK